MKKLKDILYDLPLELDELYSHALMRLGLTQSPEKLKTTKKMLTWLIGSRPWAPVQLQYLREAIAIPTEDDPCDPDEKDPIAQRRLEIGDNWNVFCEQIYRHCGPLVEIQQTDNCSSGRRKLRRQKTRAEPTWTVQLLHQTVKSFLEEKNRSGDLHIDPASAERVVVTESYNYLGFTPPSGVGRVALNTTPSTSLFEIQIIPRPHLEVTPTPKSIAVEDYCISRPLAKFAMVIVRETLDADDSILFTLMQGNKGPGGIAASMVLYWFVDAYLGFDGAAISGVAEFIEHCCQYGDLAIANAAFDLTREYQGRYEKREKLDVSSLRNRQFLMIKAAIRVFVAVFDEHPNCEHPVGDALCDQYQKYFTALDDSSNAAFDGTYDSDDLLVERFVWLVDQLRQRQKTTDTNRTATSSGREKTAFKALKTHDYATHCSLQHYRSAERDTTVRVGQIHEMISRVIDWVQHMSALNRGKDKTSRDSSSKSRSLWAVDQIRLNHFERHLMISGAIQSSESHLVRDLASDTIPVEVQGPLGPPRPFCDIPGDQFSPRGDLRGGVVPSYLDLGDLERFIRRS